MAEPDLSDQIPLPWQTTQWRRLRLQLGNNQLAHAYLLAGPGGLGKAAFARQFCLNVLNSAFDEPRSQEPNKNRPLAKSGTHPDLLFVEPEEGARDIKVEQVRALADFLTKTSHAGGAKIAIVNHAQQMNGHAANAFLKTLEEPTPGSFLFLVSDSPGSLLATIRSRCQKLQFHSPDFDQASDWLQPLIGKEHDSVKLLAASNNRPLFALELAGDGNLSGREDFTKRLYAGLRASQPIQEVVAQAMKLGESTAVECLLETSTILIGSIVAQGSGHALAGNAPDPEAAAIVTGLNSPGNARGNLQRLSNFHRLALDSWQLLRSGANPNPQLIIETLLWRWHRMPLKLQ